MTASHFSIAASAVMPGAVPAAGAESQTTVIVPSDHVFRNHFISRFGGAFGASSARLAKRIFVIPEGHGSAMVYLDKSATDRDWLH